MLRNDSGRTKKRRVGQGLVKLTLGYQGEEYDVLLRYVADEAAKVKKGGDEEEEEEKPKYTRKWYMPWKRIKVETHSKRVSRTKIGLI